MANTKSDSSQIFMGFRFQIIGMSVFVISIIFILSYVAFYFYTLNVVEDRIREDMVQTLSSAINGIDAEAFRDFTSGESAQDDVHYQQHLEWLATVQQLEPRGVVYTYIPGESNTLETQFVGDGYAFREDLGGEESAAGFLESYSPDPGDPASLIFYNGLSEQSVNMEGYSDDWGDWVSAYAPIRTDSGEVIGAMGIDFESSYVREVTNPIIYWAGIAFAVTFFGSIIIFALLTYAMSRRIKLIAEIAEQIGEGNYEQDMTPLTKGLFRDEITGLANVFEMMTAKVAQREAKLKQQVVDLKITIDQRKRDEDVGDIVESEFFQNLKTRVAGLRARRAGT